jgi:hypothetical protein
VIVRLMGGGGQFRLSDDAAASLHELDNDAVAAIDAGDAERLRAVLEQMAGAVQEHGEPLPDDDLSASDLLVPPADLSLEEARELFSGDGLIPDLPA